MTDREKEQLALALRIMSSRTSVGQLTSSQMSYLLDLSYSLSDGNDVLIRCEDIVFDLIVKALGDK